MLSSENKLAYLQNAGVVYNSANARKMLRSKVNIYQYLFEQCIGAAKSTAGIFWHEPKT